MIVDLNALHPKKMMKRLVSLFLGLLILNFFEVNMSLTIQEMFLFNITYMFSYTLFEIAYLLGILRYFKEKKMVFKNIILLKFIHYFISWFLLYLNSFILRNESYISITGTILLSIVMEVIYFISTHNKEDVSCQKNQY